MSATTPSNGEGQPDAERQARRAATANRFHRGGRSAVRPKWRLLADHLTRATGGELLLDRRLDHSDQLLQPPDLGGGERLVRDIIEHRPARTAPSHAGGEQGRAMRGIVPRRPALLLRVRRSRVAAEVA